MVTFSPEKSQWQLLGTVSWGDGCGVKEQYGVYSSVIQSLEWLRKVTAVEH